MNFTKDQQRALSITSMVTNSISFLSSSIMAIMIVRSKRRLSTPYRRIIFGINLFDIMNSLSMAFSTIASPKGTPDVWNAQGNQITCNIQGMFAYSGCVGAPLYSFALCTYYFCYTKFQMPQKSFAHYVEPTLHSIPIVYVSTTAILFLIRGLYHDVGVGCFLSSYPRGCKFIPQLKCEKGLDFHWYFIAYLHIACFFGIIIMMICIILTIFTTEKKSNRYRFQGSSSINNNTRNTISATEPSDELSSRRVFPTVTTNSSNSTTGATAIRTRFAAALDFMERGKKNKNCCCRNHVSPRIREAIVMASLYMSAYFLTSMFPYITRIVERYTGKVSFTMILLTRVFFPLQGFFNILVYTRPHAITLQKRHQYSWCMAMWRVVITHGGDVPYVRTSRRSRLTTVAAARAPMRVSRRSSRLFKVAVEESINHNTNEKDFKIISSQYHHKPHTSSSLQLTSKKDYPKSGSFVVSEVQPMTDKISPIFPIIYAKNKKNRNDDEQQQSSLEFYSKSMVVTDNSLLFQENSMLHCIIENNSTTTNNNDIQLKGSVVAALHNNDNDESTSLSD